MTTVGGVAARYARRLTLVCKTDSRAVLVTSVHAEIECVIPTKKLAKMGLASGSFNPSGVLNWCQETDVAGLTDNRLTGSLVRILTLIATLRHQLGRALKGC